MVTAIQPRLFENSIEWASVSIDLEYCAITFYMIRRRYARNPRHSRPLSRRGYIHTSTTTISYITHGVT